MLSVERRCAGKRATCSPASAISPPRLPRSAGMGAWRSARCCRFRALSARGATSFIRRGRRTPTVRGIPGARRKRRINKCVVHPYLRRVGRRYEVLQLHAVATRISIRAGHDSGPFVGATSDDGGRAHRRGPGPRAARFRFCNGIFERPALPAPRVAGASDASRETGSEPGGRATVPTELASSSYGPARDRCGRAFTGHVVACMGVDSLY